MIRRSRKILAKLRDLWDGASDVYRRLVKWAALVGAIIAIVCHHMPERYQGLCTWLARVCGKG